MAEAKTHDTPNADMIEAYRVHLVAGGHPVDTTVRSVLDLLFRLDRELPNGLRAYPQELKSWLANPDWSASTRAVYRTHIAEFYKWACEEDDPWLSYNPATRLPRPKVNHGVARPTTDEAVRRCVTEAAEPFRLICILAAYAGLRPIEIAEIRREDITEQWIVVRHGKGDKPAIIPTEPMVWQAVKRLPPGPLIRNTRGGAATRRFVSRATSEYIHKVMKLDTSLRYFRHWHGTWVLRACRNLRVTQERMRHASVATTQIYTAVAEGELLASAGQLPDFTATSRDVPEEPESDAA